MLNILKSAQSLWQRFLTEADAHFVEFDFEDPDMTEAFNERNKAKLDKLGSFTAVRTFFQPHQPPETRYEISIFPKSVTADPIIGRETFNKEYLDLGYHEGRLMLKRSYIAKHGKRAAFQAAEELLSEIYDFNEKIVEEDRLMRKNLSEKFEL